MPHSLKSKVKSLCYKGEITEKERDKIIQALENQPKMGKWIVIRKEYEFMGSVVNESQGCKCSNCDGIVKLKSDFCPNCGAEMRGE